MRVVKFAADVVVRAPAKVNLFLEVLGKRADGYHEIATLMVAIRLFDTLVFKEEPTGAVYLTCQSADLAVGSDNLVVKAAQLLRERTGSQRGARIRLVKRIPMAAGLAGGSADAAATLAGLNRLWKLGLTLAELTGLGAELGSDVPFFFRGPAAWCTGRGEKVEPVKLGRPLDLVLLCPPFGLSTAAVYRSLVLPAEPASGEALRQAVEAGEVNMIGRLLHNRLQRAAEQLDDRIAHYERRLAELGSAGRLMSGSGSSLFALAMDRSHARELAVRIRAQPDMEDVLVLQVRSCSEQPRLSGPLG